MDTLDDIPLNARSLSYSWEGYDYVLQFDGEYIFIEWQSPSYSGKSKTPLRQLKPELPVQRWVSKGARTSCNLSIYFAVAAVVVYFSDIQAHVPLLAPALLLFGLVYFYWFVRACIPLTKTVVYAQNDRYIAAIPHYDRQATQRKAFEEGLLRVIKRARGDDYAA